MCITSFRTHLPSSTTKRQHPFFLMHAGQEIHQIRHIEQRVAVGWSMRHDHGSFQMQHVLQRQDKMFHHVLVDDRAGDRKQIMVAFFPRDQITDSQMLCVQHRRVCFVFLMNALQDLFVIKTSNDIHRHQFLQCFGLKRGFQFPRFGQSHAGGR